MGKYVRREFQVGEYWLGKRAGSPAWHRFWFDRQGNRTQRVSLETADLDQAKRKLALWYAAQGEGPIGDRAMLDEVLDGYFEAHGKKLPSQQTAKRGIALWKEYFGNLPAEDAMKPYRIEQFRDWLTDRGLSTSYAARVVGVGGAALTRAYTRGVIDREPRIKAGNATGAKPKGRPLNLDELRALLRELHEEHMRRFFILSVGTGSRPDAIKDLTWEQVDLTTGIIKLNADGRTQTKKRRPTLMACPELIAEMASWTPHSGPVVTFRGEPIGSLKTSWRKARARAGLGDDCNPYSLRHSVGRWLRAERVQPWEVAQFLGHRMAGYSITELYAAADPDYMTDSRRAIGKLMNLVLAK